MHPPFFLFLAWQPAWLEVGVTGHSFGRGPPKDHSVKVWLQLARWFLRRRLKCEMLTDGRWTKSDGNSSHDLKARWANKNWQIYWSEKSFTGLGTEDRCSSWGLVTDCLLISKIYVYSLILPGNVLLTNI